MSRTFKGHELPAVGKEMKEVLGERGDKTTMLWILRQKFQGGVIIELRIPTKVLLSSEENSEKLLT